MQNFQAVLLLCGFISCFIAVNGLKCFSCDEAEAPDQCTELRECEPNSVCYLERYARLLDGKMLYRGGCRQRQICDIQKCVQDTIIGKRDGSAGIVCSECCTKELCNLKLCHFNTADEDDPTKAVRCYNCDNMEHPDKCDSSRICTLDEKCRVEVYYSNTIHEIRFRSDCHRTTECKIAAHEVSPVGRRRREDGTTNIELKSECCDHSLCNNYDPFNKTGHDSVGRINSTNVDCAILLNIPKSTTTTTPTTTTTTPTTTAKSITTVPTTATPTTSISCYVCNGPPFLCERSITPQKCSSDQQFCLNKLVNNNDGTRTVLRYCGTENECKVQWFGGTSDRDECTNYDTSRIYTHGFECTYCCTSPHCNHDLVPPKATLYVDHNQG